MAAPSHVAIIPDGNRRWARKHNLPEFEGHRISAEKILPSIIDSLMAEGVEYFTFWALSTENVTRRSPREYANLVNLMRMFLRKRTHELNKKNIRMKIIGDVTIFPDDIRKLIDDAIEKTKNNTGMTVIFGINYGGRDEILRAIRKLTAGNTTAEITCEKFREYLDTKDVPDPDLIIRTGGEHRISGFMLWQSEYAEYAFMDKLFPEITEADCKGVIKNFLSRERRYGK
ncbi:MAG: polyprenyl diphosphate synthase [Patescibacteria group bacterium]|nr:polyprenyl diphosphate synthase [Patescibacteria group bacterium]